MFQAGSAGQIVPLTGQMPVQMAVQMTDLTTGLKTGLTTGQGRQAGLAGYRVSPSSLRRVIRPPGTRLILPSSSSSVRAGEKACGDSSRSRIN